MLVEKVVIILHIACAAVWFGASLPVPGMVRRGLAGPADAKWMVGEVERLMRVSLIFGIVTIITGLILVLEAGGFQVVPHTIHWALLLAFGLLTVQLIAGKGIWQPLKRIILDGSDRAPLAGLQKRLAMTSGIRQLLWIVILALMVFP